jgi:hypothetical protein
VLLVETAYGSCEPEFESEGWIPRQKSEIGLSAPELLAKVQGAMRDE